MTKRILFQIIFFFNCLLCKSQIHGTVIIGAIATDGVLIVADSRGVIADNNKEPLAYVDSMPKLAILNSKYAIAFAGTSTLGNDFYFNLITEFNKKESNSKDVQQSMIDFRDFIFNKSKHIETSFVAGGYYNNAPYLFYFNDTTKFASQDAFVFNWTELTPYLKPYADTLVSTDSLIKILPIIIKKFAKDQNIECVIGGAISIVKITQGNKLTWIQNDLSNHQPSNYTDLVNLIEERKIKLTPCVDNGFERAIQAMKSNPKYKH